MKPISLGSLALLLLATACGGARPKNADDATTSAAVPSTGGEDMPPAPSTAASSSASAASAGSPTSTATTAPEPAPAAAPASGLKVVALKLTVPPKDAKKMGFKALEVKDDGSIVVDGKPEMKIVGGALKAYDRDDVTMFAVAADGSVTGQAGNAVGKFADNDELHLSDGAKLVVSDDGFVQWIDPKGKATVMGPKFESAPAWAKREAALLGLAFLSAQALSTAARGGVKSGAGKKK